MFKFEKLLDIVMFLTKIKNLSSAFFYDIVANNGLSSYFKVTIVMDKTSNV